jgi:hypothetical protein
VRCGSRAAGHRQTVEIGPRLERVRVVSAKCGRYEPWKITSRHERHGPHRDPEYFPNHLSRGRLRKIIPAWTDAQPSHLGSDNHVRSTERRIRFEKGRRAPAFSGGGQRIGTVSVLSFGAARRAEVCPAGASTAAGSCVSASTWRFVRGTSRQRRHRGKSASGAQVDHTNRVAGLG